MTPVKHSQSESEPQCNDSLVVRQKLVETYL